ncbi:MAG TPA: hypothetical protein VN696_02025 [Pyrinomonadaceae bacterium]|nr:hypothetical protein [Pyrinomonadaceae bacterium]
MARVFGILVTIVFASFALAACHHNVAPATDNTPDTSAYRPLATPATEFEQKLKFIRDGGFRYVWVFRRLDGKEFTHEDTEMLHTNAPKVVDWIGTDDRKTYIAGSNVGIPPENEPELKKRYKIEDHSGK